MRVNTALRSVFGRSFFLYAENPWLDQGFRKAYSYESLKVLVKDSLDIMMKRSVNCT